MNLDTIKTIFMEAAALDASPRQSAYLDSICVGDAALRKEVENLLAAQAEMGDFLECPILEANSADSVELLGERLGPFKILEQIGEGAFGIVYKAARKEAPRTVAVKVMKARLVTRQAIARFNAECRMLARMDHPHIPKVLDLGTARAPRCSTLQSEMHRAEIPHDRPYLAMELIQGIPITDFCRNRKLTIEQRLELFIEICHAVQHVHQKGVLHRDIKPANVLTTMIHGRAASKLIDFGTAKPIADGEEESASFRNCRIAGTPAYMSPEPWTSVTASNINPPLLAISRPDGTPDSPENSPSSRQFGASGRCWEKNKTIPVRFATISGIRKWW